MKIVAIILTYNEGKHLPRCLASLDGVVHEVLIVDSFSTDNTLEIAEKHGLRVVQHSFINQAKQFNWALTQLNKDTDWILRIDADEVLSLELSRKIKKCLSNVAPDIDGVVLGRRMTFQGKMIRHGGMFPVRILRLFRYGRGECERRMMDEHIRVVGPTIDFDGEIIDDNLNSITCWIDKHNKYASREAVELLNLEYNFLEKNTEKSLLLERRAGLKRWIKENIYTRTPIGLRAFIYFLYRYVIRLGFLDGQTGTAFHVLQGFWYRYLVDLKIMEVKHYMRSQDCDVITAIKHVLNIEL